MCALGYVFSSLWEGEVRAVGAVLRWILMAQRLVARRAGGAAAEAAETMDGGLSEGAAPVRGRGA
jgi:hypothetical protein